MGSRSWKLRRIISVAESKGATVKKPKRGSHWKFRYDQKTFPIPAHNGMKSKIDACYVKALCETFDWNEDEFRDQL